MHAPSSIGRRLHIVSAWRHDDNIVGRRPPLPGRAAVWHFPNRWGESADRTEGYGAYYAFMKGPYHLIYFWETGERCLYNIREDIGERNDIASAELLTLRAMSRELSDSLRAMGAQRPKFKVTGQICPWPDEADQR